MIFHPNDTAKHRLKTLALLLAVLSAGACMTWWIVSRADREMRASLLQKTRMIAEAVNVENVLTLSGTGGDLTSPAYQRLKEQLSATLTIYPHCRFVYLLGRKPDGSIFFFVDSEPADSKDCSPPGQVFDEATAGMRRTFTTQTELVEGPYTDRWGDWVSALVPIFEPQTRMGGRNGSVLAVFCMDIDARDWNWRILRSAWPPVLLTLALALILMAGSVVLERRSWIEVRRPRETRNTRLALVAAVGIVLTLFAAWLAHELETDSCDEAFGRLAASQTAAITETFCKLRDTELEGLAHFCEANPQATPEEFKQYTAYLTKNPAIQAWEWIPAVAAADKSRFEEAARAGGWKEFEIWQKDVHGNRVPATGRDFYYPVFKVSPLTGNERAVGYDTGSEPLRRAALEEAVHTKLPTGSDPITLVQEVGDQKGMLMCRPVVSAGDSSRLLGFAVAVVRMGTLISIGDTASSLPVQLTMLRKAAAPELLASTGPNGRSFTMERAVTRPVFAFGKVFVVTICPGEENLILWCHPGQASFIALLIGLLMTSALAILVSVLLRRREELERLVTEITKNQLIAQHARDPLLLVALDGRILDGNHAAGKLYGYSREELLQLRIGDLRAHDHPETVSRQMAQAQRQGILFEATHICKNGTVVPVEVNAQSIFFEGQEMLLSVIRDITERKAAEESLRLQSGALEAAANAIVITDPKGVIQWTNAAFTTFTGYSAAEAAGKTFRLLKSGKQDQAFYRALWSTILAGEVWHGELIDRRKDGSLYPLEMTITPMKDGGGTITHFIAVKQDITKRKRDEAALLDAEALGASIRDSLLEHIAVLDAQGVIIAVNLAWKRFARMNGAPGYPADSIGLNYLKICEAPPGLPGSDDSAAARAGILAVMDGTCSEFEMEYPCHSPSEQRWFQMRVLPLYGSQKGVVVAHLNITQRKLAQAALLKAHLELEERVAKRTAELNQSKDQLQLLLDSTAEAIYGIDLHGECTFCNSACLRMLGYEREEQLLGTNMHWQIHQNRANGVRFPVEDCRIFRAFQANEGSHVDDEVLWRADGTSFAAEYWSYPQRIDGVAVGAVVTFIDITERKRAEGVVLQNVARTEELVRLKSRFVSMASHELRTPLANIMLACDLLKNFGNAMPAERSQPVLSGLINDVASMVQTLDDLLLAGKLEEGKLAFTPAPFPLRDLLKRCCLEVGCGLKSPSRIDIAFLDAGRRIIADERLLYHILTNLLENALKYSPPDTRVELGVEAGPGSLTLSVLDRGIGVPEAERKFLFDAFSRASNVGDKPGSGLGLFIAQKCAQAHGGQLRYTPHPAGSIFSVTIPLAASDSNLTN